MSQAERGISDLSKILGKQDQLDEIGAEILNAGPRAIRYRETGAGGKSMVFVAHHAEVVKVLTDESDFSLCHYDPLYSAVTPKGAFLIMRPEGPERAQRLAILRAAAARTPWFGPNPARRRALARECVDNILTAVRPRRRFDLIGEYGYFAPYLIAKRVIGITGPRSLDLLSLYICFKTGHFFQLFAPETGPYLADIAWSEIVLAQLLTNFENRSWLVRTPARCAAANLRAHIERHIDAFKRTAGDETLLNALWSTKELDFPSVDDKVYREHVVSIMMELGATILLFPGSAFLGIIDRWLAPGGPGLRESLNRLQSMDAEAFVQEELRLGPPSAHLLRNATARVELGGLTVERDEYVCALVKTAGGDITDEPAEVRAGRSPNTYLHFGPEGGPHRCFGDLLAPAILAELFLGLTRVSNITPRGGSTGRPGLVPGRLMVHFSDPVGTGP